MKAIPNGSTGMLRSIEWRLGFGLSTCVLVGGLLACSGGASNQTVPDCAFEGASRCEAGSFSTCASDANGVLGWSVPVPCVNGECANRVSCGGCSNTCSTAGITQCADGAVQRCVVDGEGCLDWSLSTTCPGDACEDARACQGCTHSCRSVGEQKCEMGAEQVCLEDELGCRAWSAPRQCERDACENDQTCLMCPTECTLEGAANCSEGQLQECIVGARGCRVWQEQMTCPDGFCGDSQSCGQCENTCEEAGVHECAEGQTRSCTIDNNGCLHWKDWLTCDDGFCADATKCGTCSALCSAAGDMVCVDGLLSTCTVDKNDCIEPGSNSTVCPEGFCADNATCGTCDNTCSDGETSCANGRTTACVVDQNGCFDWGSNTMACGSGSCADAAICYDCDLPIHVDASSIAQAPTGRSWDSAFQSLHDAFAAVDSRPSACSTAELWVAKGSYTPTTGPSGGVPQYEANKDVSVYGGFNGDEDVRGQRNPIQHRTILRGGAGETRLIYLRGRDRSLFDGFVVTGFATAGHDIMYIIAGSVELSNMLFAANVGGNLVFAVGDQLIVRDSVLVGNSGTLVRSFVGTLRIDRTVVSRNLSGRISLIDESGIISNTAIVGNTPSSDVIYGRSNSTLLLENSLIAGNEKNVLDIGFATATNVTVLGNNQAFDLSTAVTAHNSVFSGITAGGTNFTTDPTTEFAGYATSSGAWTASAQYDTQTFQTVLTDTQASWVPDEFADMVVEPQSGQLPWAYIVDNTETTLTVWGDVGMCQCVWDTA